MEVGVDEFAGGGEAVVLEVLRGGLIEVDLGEGVGVGVSGRLYGRGVF